jgi:hypothetical protein
MRFHDWGNESRSVATDETIVSQAVEVAANAVRMALADALRAADRCGCLRCRQRAATTIAWAVEFLEIGNDLPAARDRPRRPWS